MWMDNYNGIVSPSNVTIGCDALVDLGGAKDALSLDQNFFIFMVKFQHKQFFN